MSEGSEKIKRLVSFKESLEKKVGDLETELKDLQSMLEAVSSILLEKGFRRAEISKEVAQPETLSSKAEIAPERDSQPPLTSTEPESATPLKTVAGELLASILTSENSLRVVPAEDKTFDINTPPFAQFLVERVLTKMQERDNELVRTGQLGPDKIFSYNIVQEGDVIREIVIRNVDADRLRELKSSIRWTLEKMYEKMRSQD
jgi:hypothetical protein